MPKEFQITASIVLFNENIDELRKCIKSFLSIPHLKKLFLIDNSSTDILKSQFENIEIEYIFNGKNLGFGTAHNLIINKIRYNSEYHLILNPDVIFEPQIISKLIGELRKKNDVAIIAPKVISPDGKIQYSCRKYPTFFELFSRRIGIFKKYTQNREYRNTDLKQSFYPDFIQGSFLLFKTNDFVKINGFDERYFLYMEDVDICKKLDTINKRKLYFPEVEIVHIHKKESSKNILLFFIHLQSIIKYFYKWGLK
ncbi:glycosyltransferase family 2 protein [Aureibaculum sp. 2210JD6-5]|uniref:glycosyltransferase family 2 protein n=1 Tax=Aureibaculum sp. 2210JD6-5 TaxID=3103957 RepID=UPI002AAECCB7|nr:glycosyltransferase family 2 protein [Aureibaculum sp. 2210JD6-5]MDY7396185.1 glycosyltransferase family 2 protein [Aureibaculum sp. 2210JD6-5]